MKKQTIIKTLLSLALVFMLSVTVSTTTLKAQETSAANSTDSGSSAAVEYVYGDANGDGIVNAADVLLLRLYMANYDYETGKSTVVLGPPVHSHEFTQQNTDSKYLKSEATCTTHAEYYYSCACGEIGTDTFKSGSTLPHTYDCQNTHGKYLKSEATEQSPAVYYYSCTCGEKGELTFFHGNALGDYLAPVFTLSSDGNSYAVSGATGDGSILEIPETHDGLSVVAIANNAFYGNTKIKKVDIPDSVTSIGYSAFENCSSLESIIIPDSVTSIGSYAFYGCSSLESITIPFVGEAKSNTSNTHFGYIFGATSYSYNDDYVPSSLKTVVITGGTSIGKYAFYNCSGLTSVTIPDSVTNIGSSAFEECSGLTSVTIPDSVTSIDYEAFYGCSGLTSVHITDIAKWCGISFSSFSNYSANPLYYAKNLYLNGELVTELVIPEGVTSIGSSAFYNCSGLTSVTIPDSVTRIGNYAFRYCSGLTSITVGTGNTKYHSVGNCLIETNSRTLILGSNNSIIPSDGSVKSIGDYAFYGCSGLTSITIPDRVTSIGDYAFYGCSGLESITIPFVGATKDGTSNTHFGYLFGAKSSSYNDEYVPESLKTVVITGGTSIGDYAFRGCSGLTSVTIPDSVTSIGYYAFIGCSGLTSITVDAGNTKYHSAGNCLIETSSRTLILGCKNSVIPSDGSVKSIGYEAFYGCSDLMSITIPDRIASIGSSAFFGCSGLTSITIPDRVTSIGSSAFRGCSSLESITIPFVGATKDGTSNTHFGYIFGASSSSYNDDYVPSSLKTVVITGGTSIGSSAFRYCSGLTDVKIPDSVKSIGSYAFSGCSNLASVTIPDSVTSIGDTAFYGCSGLTSVTIGNSVTSIGEDAFYKCSGLTSITVGTGNTKYHSAGNCLIETSSRTLILGSNNSIIPSDGSVKSIGSSAFYKCIGLTSVTIPDSVTSIGSSAFYGCSGLTSIIFEDTSTWYRTTSYSDWQNKTGGTSTSVTDYETNATYFKSTYYYCNYYWYKK